MPGAAGSRGSAAAFRAPRTSRFPSSNEVAKRTEPSAEGIDGPMQKILDGAAELEALGIAPAWREQLAFICGYTNPRSGGFSEPLGRLIARELMAAAGAGQVQLTHNGRAAAWLPERPSTSAELQARILAALDGPEAKILGALIGLYPEDITRDHLGSGCGYKNPRSGGFSEPLGKLIRLGLVEVPHRGRVRAARLLSLEGGH